MASSSLHSSLGRLSLISTSPAIKEGEYRNWSELLSELTSSILQRLGTVDILENAQKVCTSWRRVCKDPAMWRKIVMHKDTRERVMYNLYICRHALDRSQGGLVEIDIFCFATDSLLNYIANSSSGLRRLKVAMLPLITNKGLTEALVMLPLLEELEVSYCWLSAESLKVVGQSCPNIKTLKLNHVGPNDPRRWSPRFDSDDDSLVSDSLKVIKLERKRLCKISSLSVKEEQEFV